VALVQILRVFAAAVPDIPPHRQEPLFLHLLEHVRVDTYLWVVLAVFLECGIARALESGAENAPNPKHVSLKFPDD
jgi:hypothetical protein